MDVLISNFFKAGNKPEKKKKPAQETDKKEKEEKEKPKEKKEKERSFELKEDKRSGAFSIFFAALLIIVILIVCVCYFTGYNPFGAWVGTDTVVAATSVATIPTQTPVQAVIQPVVSQLPTSVQQNKLLLSTQDFLSNLHSAEMRTA